MAGNKKSQPKPPAPPDPTAVAAAQGRSNVNTALANARLANANTYTPFGSTTFSPTGTVNIGGQEIPQYSSTTTLSPEEQARYNQYNALATQAGNQIAAGPDFSNLPDVTNDFSADRTAVENALFNRLNPQVTNARNDLEAKLVNQGLTRGTDAFNRAMDENRRAENDLRLDITARGLGEQQGLFNMAQANRSRAFNEAMSRYGAMPGAFGALAGVLRPNVPSASFNATTISPTDIAGPTYNSAALANQNYNTEMAQRNAQMGGLFGLGQAGIMAAAKYGPALMAASDRRLKRDVRDLGVQLLNGIKLYAYRYMWDAKERVGVMADEVLKIIPAAVSSHNGYLAVNYGMIHGD